MPDTLLTRLRQRWNTFVNRKSIEPEANQDLGPAYSIRPDRPRLNRSNERSIVSSLYTRLAIDVASVSIQHVRVDQNGRYMETIASGLNNCLNVAANIDQTGRSFIQDVVLSMFDEGVVAIVPVDTTTNLAETDSFDIDTMRTGKILQWYPKHVRLEIYNDRSGRKEQIVMPKNKVAIVENPLYQVMNEPNSTLKRLIRKLNLLDAIDEQSGSGKLDLIIQLPYVIKTEARKQQAEARRQDIETQLSGSKYGIAYTDGTERVTQLNRPAENNLMAQIEFLTSMLYSQLGLTENIFNGSAEEKELLSYYSRTIEPILAAICDAMRRTFITKTGRTQGQSIMYFRDPFRLVPIADLATAADSFTRNAILSSNDIRSVIGWKPSSDKEADQLRNKNLNPPTTPVTEVAPAKATPDQNGKEQLKDGKNL